MARVTDGRVTYDKCSQTAGLQMARLQMAVATDGMGYRWQGLQMARATYGKCSQTARVR